MTNRETLLICLSSLDAEETARALYADPVEKLLEYHCLTTCTSRFDCPFEAEGELSPESCERCLAAWLEKRCEDIDPIRKLFIPETETKGDQKNG